jgi:hypothetical protein
LYTIQDDLFTIQNNLKCNKLWRKYRVVCHKEQQR